MTKEEILREKIIELDNSNKKLRKSIQDAQSQISNNNAGIDLLQKELLIESLLKKLREKLMDCEFTPVAIDMTVKGEHQRVIYNIARKV